jgi:hypothetical protein
VPGDVGAGIPQRQRANIGADELELIVPGAAVSLGLSLVGFALPVASAVAYAATSSRVGRRHAAAGCSWHASPDFSR